MRIVCQTALGVVVAAHVAAGQTPRALRIEIRKVKALVDSDGRGFNSPPRHVIQISGGRFLLTEENHIPVVLDSNGRFLQNLGREGQGPGEFNTFGSPGPFRVGLGETLFVRNNGVSVLSPDLQFVRAVQAGIRSIGDFLPAPGGFIVSKPVPGPNNTSLLFHVTDKAGNVLRSFGKVVNGPRTTALDRKHALSPSTEGAFWAAPYIQHRFERWTNNGIRTAVIDTQPPWYIHIPLDKPGLRSDVRAFREVAGRLWVMSAVPVSNPDEVIRKATGRKYRGVDEGRSGRLPLEMLTTTMLEVYDIRSRRLVAELPVPAFGVTFIDDSHFMLYTTNASDLPQLEIWEMRIGT